MSSADPTPDPHVAAALARAERRRARLEELSELGMGLARELTSRAVEGPYHPEPRHDPARAFASIARAVRFTLALEAKVEERILALRKGELPKVAGGAAAPFAPCASGPEAALGSRRERLGEAAAIDETDDEADEERACAELDGLYERLTEREYDDALLSRPWRASVAAVCGDLGVEEELDEIASSLPRSGEGGLSPAGESRVGGRRAFEDFRAGESGDSS